MDIAAFNFKGIKTLVVYQTSAVQEKTPANRSKTSHYTASWNCNLLPTLNKHLFNGTSVLLLHIMTYQSFLLMCNSILSVVRFAGPFFLSKLPLVAEKRKSCSFRRWSWATKRYKKICGTWFFFAAIFNYDHFGSSEWCSNFKCYASPFLNKGLHAMEFCLQFVKQIPKKKNYSKDSSFPHLGSMNGWLQLATRSFRVRLFFFESVKSRINDLAWKSAKLRPESAKQHLRVAFCWPPVASHQSICCSEPRQLAILEGHMNHME